jgi:hypothetical protein
MASVGIEDLNLSTVWDEVHAFGPKNGNSTKSEKDVAKSSEAESVTSNQLCVSLGGIQPYELLTALLVGAMHCTSTCSGVDVP